MWMLGPIGFTTPWLLLGLLALPLLYVILRAVPPAPVRRRFPGVALLLGLHDRDAEAARTPWWLLALRMLALAAAIIGFSGPVLNPVTVGATGSGPLLIVTDGSWASARDWSRRIDRIGRALDEAAAAGRPVAMISLADPPPEAPPFGAATALRETLPGLKPAPWEPGADIDPALILPEGSYETLWLSDGLERDARPDFLSALEEHGTVNVWQSAAPIWALGAARIEDGVVNVPVFSAVALASTVEVIAMGLDPAGIERELARTEVAMDARTQAIASFDLPPELRNRVTRFEVAGLRSAGAVSLTDDAVKRRKVALISAGVSREGLELLDPSHFLREALDPTADLIEGTLEDVLLANPDVVILADVAEVPPAGALQDWVEDGGLLLRFAGPRLAMTDTDLDPLLPVKLRAGGRSIGGTMSWGEPRQLAAFPAGSPFEGLEVSPDVTVSAQVMAEPSPELAERTIAQLADGTPLVTRARFGDGTVVLVHVTANAEWSTLPLSILFPKMLERLAVSTRPTRPDVAELEGTTWVPQRVIDGFGRLTTAEAAAGVAGEDLAMGHPSADLPPGVYADDDRSVALNALAADRVLAPAQWPNWISVEGVEQPQQTPLKGALLALSLLALMVDIVASLALSGRLRGPRAASAMMVALAMIAMPQLSKAQEAMAQDRAIAAAGNVVLAHILTGDPQVDQIAQAGLTGLTNTLTRRTTVEPSPPLAIDLERDDLALFTLIYWPVTANQSAPSPAAYAKLNRYLRGGGMILFDTRDADVANFGGATPAGQRLQALAAPLDIPPLAPISNDHVLTRTFYLLQSFPGRYDQPIWVEAPLPDAEQAEGMPFRNLNDGVTPVVIGGNDWAGAWAVDNNGIAMFPVGRGLSGERQREMALRFGVNLVMHVLTGNYKSDQVHVPALLERLGQ
ncbi:LytTR family transcriptional regulator [Thioclava sp. SK-1]|uniref:DUF4159 domain-containing protein n=1 Tax=Thioclava sp. SK-1 TaxID=1889770 RepID=UPI0008253BAC|nr:DUF4159 domain-containing protein [Thioclava sp. SK-1]OCX66778.1 LytTR family transcriptional regulator [Thioclava sp. SK-1]